MKNYRMGATSNWPKNRLAMLAAMSLAGTMLSAAPAFSYSWITVANSNTEVPGAAGAKFSSFNQPSINNDCRVVFRARGKGPGEPPTGIFHDNPCKPDVPVRKKLLRGGQVPQPNNLSATFNEFPAFARIAAGSNLIATRGQSKPVWEYTLPDMTETRVGTAGIYAGMLDEDPRTGASQTGVIPLFSYYDVPHFPGTKFDQFPGAPAAFSKKFIAFKGNFTETLPETMTTVADIVPTISRTGVYYRNIYDGGKKEVRRVADSTMNIPGTDTKFGSTAPPSAASGKIVFLGLDIEEAPTMGAIYRHRLDQPGVLTSLAAIGGAVPAVAGETFNRLGEGLSYNGRFLAYWGAWGDATRTVRLHCPADGNADIIAECKIQCPTTDEIGNYCEKEVQVNQGIFLRREKDGKEFLIARSGAGYLFQDFQFWVFSGRPPGVGESDSEDPEPPRWRASSFVAAASNDYNNATVVFKGSKSSGESGLYIRKRVGVPVTPLLLLGASSAGIDPKAPVGSVVTAVGVERDGLRNCQLAINASFLNETTSESWAGIYVEKNVCPAK